MGSDDKMQVAVVANQPRRLNALARGEGKGEKIG